MPLYEVEFTINMMVAAATERDAVFEARSHLHGSPELEHAEVFAEEIDEPRRLTASQARSYPYGGGKTCQKMAEEAAAAAAAAREETERAAEIARVQVPLFGGDRG